MTKNTPSALFRLLCAAMLMSARIRSPIAVEATRRPSAGKLAKLAGDEDYPRLVAALVRVELEDDYEAVRRAA